MDSITKQHEEIINEELTQNTKKGAPEWAIAAFDRFLAQKERLWNVTRLSVYGISMTRLLPNTLEALAKGDAIRKGTSIPEPDERLKLARKDAELAQHEVDTGFSLVYSNAIVALWSILESMARSIVVAWLKNDANSFQIDSIAKLRIRIGDYENHSQDERFYYIADLLENDLAAKLRNGIDRFEALLKPFDLDGAVPKKLCRDIFEFGQVRNAIVHSGTADQQLSGACPWLGFPVGQGLPIIGDHFERYNQAADHYVTLLICRTNLRFGVDLTEFRQNIFKLYDAT